MERIGLLAILVGGMLAVASAAGAQSADDERARRHFSSGESYYAEGDFENALREFQHALQLSARPGLYYNLYLVEERLGMYREAADHLERYLEEGTVSESDRPMLTRRLENLRRRVETRPAEQTEETTPVGDQQPSDGASPTPEPTPEDDSGGGGGIGVGPIVAYGIGGAGLVTFAIFAGLAAAENGSVSTRCGSASTATCTDDDLSTLHTFALVADIGLGIMLAGAAVGTVLLLVGGGSDDDDGPADEPSAFAAPWFAPGAGGAAVAGSF